MTFTLRKWYFAVNERGLSSNLELIRAAVTSCRLNTDLDPHCIYVGRQIPRLDNLRNLGVTIVTHQPSLRPELEIGYGKKYHTFSGHWLRVDIPEIEQEDDFVLYTDIDVVFRSMPATLNAPLFIAVAPEHEQTNWSYFNSGVMLMNLPALRREMPGFKAAMRARLTGNFTYPTHDQASFNTQFAGRFDRLPLEMNWKPYWGENPDAHIIHFHGPKPRLARNFANGAEFTGNPAIQTIWERDPQAYDVYSKLFFEIAGMDPDRLPSRTAEPTVICPDTAGPLTLALRDTGRRVAGGLDWTRRSANRLRSSLRARTRPKPHR
jgi:hypothetical protein